MVSRNRGEAPAAVPRAGGDRGRSRRLARSAQCGDQTEPHEEPGNRALHHQMKEGNRSRGGAAEKPSLFDGLDAVRIRGKPVLALLGQRWSILLCLPALRAPDVGGTTAVPGERLGSAQN